MSPSSAFLAGLALGAAAAAAGMLWDERRRARRLGRFLSHAAHEINTPITVINITVLNTLSGVFGELPPEQVKWIELMREQVGRLNGMVGELRDLVHLVLRRDLVLHAESAVPGDLAAAALTMVQRSAAQSETEVKADLPAGLPRVRVDRDRTIRTLTSLFFHARKFRSTGDIRLSGESRDGRVLLRLEYQGRPMSPDAARRSLELMYPAFQDRQHTLSAVGLGLGMLRALARIQGGDLDLAVGPDGRSALTLALALAKE